MKHLIILALAVAAMAQKPLRTTGMEVYDQPNSRVRRQLLSSGTVDVYNVAGARRVGVSSAGGLSTTVGIVETLTGAAGVETYRNRLDSVGVNTNGAVSVFDSTTPSQIRQLLSNGTLDVYNVANMKRVAISSAGGTSTTVGIIETLTGSAGAETYRNRLDTVGVNTNGSVSVFDSTTPSQIRQLFTNGTADIYNVSGARRVSVSSAGGVSTSTGIMQVLTGAAGSEQIATKVSESVELYDSAGALLTTLSESRLDVNAKDGGGTVRDRVSIRSSSTAGTIYLSDVATGSEKTRVFIGFGEVSASSLNLQDDITAPTYTRKLSVPTAGTSFLEWRLPELDGSVGDCLKRATNGGGGVGRLEFGACGGAGSVTSVTGSGVITVSPPTGAVVVSCPTCVDTGSTQSLTGLKTWQMPFGGDAIRVNNNSGVLKGSWSDIQLAVGDVAAGGRGIALSAAGTFNLFNASGTQVASITYSGGTGVYKVHDGTVLWNGLSLTCSVGQTTRQPIFVSGLLVSGGCGL